MSHDPLSAQELYADNYVLTERLGSGGTGTVYRARHLLLQQVRALKVLHSRRGVSANETLKQLQLEASVFGRLRGNHHIVMPLDIGFDRASQTHFLAMELLHGADLSRWVNLMGPLSVERTLRLMRQVAAGVDAAHGYVDDAGRSTPIVHRDLTPSNLFLLRPESSDPDIKILDFGLAAVLDRTDAIVQSRNGTPQYRSYEQANGLELVPQTDIWALALVVHFALTGHSYWRHSRADALHEEITSGALDPPSARLRERAPNLHLPEAFDAWFLRCLQRVPARRFKTAGVAIDELGLCFEASCVDPHEPLISRSDLSGAMPQSLPAQSHTRTAAPTQPTASAESSHRARNTADSADVPLLQLAERFHPLLRGVLRLSDDLMTATGHYLAFPPKSTVMLQRQLEGVRHHVVKYNDARDLLRRQLGAYEGLLRRMHAVGPPALYEAAREALAMALEFNERFPLPLVAADQDDVIAFTRECTYWQAERVLLHAQLEVGRQRLRALEEQVARAASTFHPPPTLARDQGLRGAELLDGYARSMVELAVSVRRWIDGVSHDDASLEQHAWAMAPHIEAMNDAYVELDGASLTIRVVLQESDVPLHRRVVDDLSTVHDFQWYEFRPLLNGPLVQVIHFLCSDTATTLREALLEECPRWHRLARTLEAAASRYGISSGQAWANAVSVET